ncbi:DUF4240 domain-containing protein [Xanthocytophaga agilis]|uniref:DUF4240 domain-containing protein n=1 Tax=Xanthocytophaga agilis TaxID=3048010 RepID=A0AAE3UEQ1_9BACT|nr:DUF4240 domain-containing protein [Xanthocytophaga agilis]MDJ1499788.1 DUF4240 domain-containing protein [Xanthocytophaga agilis]
MALMLRVEYNMISKPVMSPTEEEDFFWNAIEKSNRSQSSHWSDYNIEEHLENLIGLLSHHTKEELIIFEKVFQEKMYELYTANIAELSIILENGYTTEEGKIIFDDYISTDGFIYFRCWLILKGKQFFEEITEDINAFINGKYSFDIGDTWAEGLLYVSDEAYSANHENQDNSEIQDAVANLFPDVIHYDSLDGDMDGVPIGGEDLQDTYPQLVKEITDLRNK